MAIQTETPVSGAVCTLSVRIAWWVWPYLNTVDFMCTLTGLDPDMDKVRLMVFKGLKVTIVR